MFPSLTCSPTTENNTSKWTCLHWAAAGSHKETVEFLLQQGEELKQALEGDGKTAADVAFERGQKEMAEFLVSNGIPRLVSKDGSTSIYEGKDGDQQKDANYDT